MLAEIEQLFGSGDQNDALALLNDYLVVFPENAAAELLKLEFCLAQQQEPGFVGQTLDRLAQAPPDAQQVRRLCQARQGWLDAALIEGRRQAARGQVGEAINSLDVALALAPSEPGVAFAAAQILLSDQKYEPVEVSLDISTLELFKRLTTRQAAADSSLAFKQQVILKYLEPALQGSAPGSPLHTLALAQLVRIHLDTGQVPAALALLADAGDSERDLSLQVGQSIVEFALSIVQHLLRLERRDAALALLETCRAAAPDLPIVHLLAAEAWTQAGRPGKAQAAYHRALRSAPPAPTGSDGALSAALAAWEQASAIQIACPCCLLAVSPEAEACPYCAAPLVKAPLLTDRYHLAEAPDAVIARVGLAHLKGERGEIAPALRLLDAALADLPEDHASREHLETQRAAWVARLAPAQEDTAANVIGQWQREGLTPAVALELARTCQTAPTAGWAAIALQTRRALVRSVIEAGRIELAQTALDAVFADNPSRKTVARLRTLLAEVTAAWMSERLAQGWQALRSGMPEIALGIADSLLDLAPANAAARLLRGEAHQADGNIVFALDDFRAAIAAAAEPAVARNARLGAARTLEASGDFEQAQHLLRDLPGADAEEVRARLDRRQRGEPAVRLERSTRLVMDDTLQGTRTRPFCHAYFAIAVRAVSRPWPAGEGWNDHIHTASYEFVQALAGLSQAEADPVLALRLISQPHPDIAERGRLSIAFLVRVSAPTETAARDFALSQWRTIKTMLPLGHEHVFAYEPVTDAAELAALLRPFRPDTVSEIVRRESVPQRGGDRFAVYPFTASGLDLHNLCWTLLRQPVPAMISIHLVPTALRAWEQATFDRAMLGENDPASIQERAQAVDDPPDSISQWWKAAAQLGPAQANHYLFETLRTRPYLLRVNVASRAGASLLLPEMAAAALFGPPVYNNGVAYGGYEIARAGTLRERAVLRRNLAAIDVEQWVFSAAPEGLPRLRHLVSEREAALTFRLPVPGQEGIPGVALMDAKPVAPPPGLPARGTILGESVIRTGGLPMRIMQAMDDRRRHSYIVGRTGAGKTTLIENLVLQDIEAGQGVCVVDPHGDLIEELLARIPARRAADVILFDASDETRPIGLNLLDAPDETAKQRVTSEFIALLTRMYDPHNQGIVGPRFQHNVRHAMLTAMSVEGSTLIEVVRVLTDHRFVRRILPHIKDPLLRRYWTDQIANTSDFHKSEILDYIVSKFSRFVGDARIRHIVGQRKTTINFREIMDQRKVLLVSLSKGKIGPESAQFLGLLLMQELLIAALSRSDQAVDQRPDFFLYVDEFQNFATDLFGTMLSEGRKYGIVATVANQYLTQLPHDIREAIFGNVQTLVSFRLGTQDAVALHQEMHPLLGADDLLNLPKYAACVKLLVDGVATRPFTMRTLPDTRVPDAAQAERLREASRLAYGRDSAEVSAEIFARYDR